MSVKRLWKVKTFFGRKRCDKASYESASTGDFQSASFSSFSVWVKAFGWEHLINLLSAWRPDGVASKDMIAYHVNPFYHDNM